MCVIVSVCMCSFGIMCMWYVCLCCIYIHMCCTCTLVNMHNLCIFDESETILVLKCNLCLEKEMQVVTQSREGPADERKFCLSRQAAQMCTTSIPITCNMYMYISFF